MSAGQRFMILATVVVAASVLLSLAFSVPYVFTVTGFAGLAFLGHVVTIDEDLRGGWGDTGEKRLFPWGELLSKAVVFFGLCWAIAAFPALRSFGGSG
jgi:hypothetical protein